MESTTSNDHGIDRLMTPGRRGSRFIAYCQLLPHGPPSDERKEMMVKLTGVSTPVWKLSLHGALF